MATSLDNDDDDILQPVFATNAFTITPEMIDNVLAVCPGVHRDVIREDLHYTNNITTTINRLLDGVQNSPRVVNTAINSPQLTSKSRSTVAETPCASAPVVCLSDTDVDSDLENDRHDDQNSMDADDVAIVETTQQIPFSLRKKITHNTSEIIDLSFDDNDDYSSTSNNKSSIITKRTTKSSQNLSELDRDYIQIDEGCDLNVCAARVTDISSSDSDSDSLPSILPSSSQSTLINLKSNSPNTYTGSLDDDFGSLPSVFSSSSAERGTSLNTDSQSTFTCSLDNDSQSVVPKKKKNCTAEETQQRKEEAKTKRAMKEKEKQAKREQIIAKRKEKEKEKLLKEYIRVYLDPEFMESMAKDGDDVNPILVKLSSLGVSYAVKSHPIPSSITWARTSVSHTVDDSLQIQKENTLEDDHHVIVRVLSDSFVAMVDAFKNARSGCPTTDQQSFETFSRSLLKEYPNNDITILVVGLDKYFSKIKSKAAREYRNAIRGETDNPGRKKHGSLLLVVSKVDVEEFLVFVEVTTEFKIILCETMQIVADTVAMFTKAVAEAPFKKSQPDAFSFCIDSRTSSVKVSKDGQGLVKLWQQQLQQFHNVSASMAAAIVSVYPSPMDLIKAYEDCPNAHSASLLLKDILVRRGTGVLATSRRIGPELSRQIYLLFNSTDGDTMTK